MNEIERESLRRFTAAAVKTNRALAKVNRKMQRDLPRFRAAMQELHAALDRSYRV